MRPALVLSLLALAFLARIAFGDGPEGSFDDRFTRAEHELEELASSIESELEPPQEDAAQRQ